MGSLSFSQKLRLLLLESWPISTRPPFTFLVPHNKILHDAVFQPASKIEQLKVDIIEQSDDINTEFIAAITNGKNSNVFKLGQKYGYIFHLISLLFVWYGFRQTIAS